MYSAKWLGAHWQLRVGGDLITKDVVKTAGPVNPEFIFERNPDIIMIIGSYWPKRNRLHMRLGFDTNEAKSQELLKASPQNVKAGLS